MLHRLFTGVVLAVALWYAMAFLQVSHNLALMIAALPILAAVLNLLTGVIFALAALVAVPVIFYFLAIDEPWFAPVVAAVRKLAELR